MLTKITILSFFIFTLFLSLPTYAHVTANPNEAEAGTYFQTSFRISHGCEGSDTIKVTIKLPSGLVSVKPQFKSGWTTEIVKRKLPEPVSAGHGKMMDEEFSEITWVGGKLPDSHYDEFGLVIKLPDEGPEILWFPLIQDCVKGNLNWTEIPNGIPAKKEEWKGLKSPAPFIRIIKSSHHNHH
jgi:uncharacterized protein YcnI